MNIRKSDFHILVEVFDDYPYIPEGIVITISGVSACYLACPAIVDGLVTTILPTLTSLGNWANDKIGDVWVRFGVNVAKGLRLGQDFGKLGKVIENGSGTITGKILTDHVIKFHPNVTEKLMIEVVSQPLVRLAQAGDRILYLTEKGVVVLDKIGNVITAYTGAEFTNPAVLLILKLIGK